MKSIYAKLLLWVFATLALALVGYVVISFSFSRRGPHDLFRRDVQFQLDETVEAYQTKGVPGLAAYLRKLDQHFPGEHVLCDAAGKNLVTGANHSALVREAERRGDSRPERNSHLAFAQRSHTGRYWYLVISDPPLTPWTFFSFFVLVLGAVAILCWVLAADLGAPLRSLARTVDRFGRGDLQARAHFTRKDEIGEMARAFDRMAERIGTLLSAERRLLRDISHELRSPLARLSFAAELTRTADDRDAAAARLKREISRLTSLVGSLIEMTRVEGDPESQVRKRVDLEDLLREIEGDVRVEADAKQCSVVLRAGSAAVAGDRELLRRAFENIIRNAIRYAPPDTVVDITAQSQNGSAHVSVRDFGPGVPEDALAKIFQPFFRVDGSRDTSTGGVGLGLAITERAISVHHGRIRATNAQPGLLVDVEMPSL